MKTYLTLFLMMISTFAWAMPSAKYIPADTVGMMTFHFPQQSLFIKELNTFVTQNKESSFLDAMPLSDLYVLESYGVSPEMHGDYVVLNILGEDEWGMMFLEGTFDVDVVLAKIRQSPDALCEMFEEEGLVCGKMPGGIYICSGPIEERVKALLAGKEEPISPTSAFAKLVNEKNEPDRLAIRALAKGGKGGLKQLREGNLSAAKFLFIERTPGVVDVDYMFYAKTMAPFTRFDTHMQGFKMVLDPFMKATPALKRFVNQVKTTVDTTKKRLTLSGSVTVKDIEMIEGVFNEFTVTQMNESMTEDSTIIEDADAEDPSLTTSPTFTIEKIENFVDNKDQSKTLAIGDRTVTLRAGTHFYRSFDIQGIESQKPSIELKLYHPADLDIEMVYVMQGTKRLSTHPTQTLRHTYTLGNRDAQDVSSFCIFGKVTGDIQVVVEYRIDPMTEDSMIIEDDDAEDLLLTTSPTFTVEKLEDLVDKKDQSRIFTIEGHAVTISATDASYVDKSDKKKCVLNWDLSMPANLTIEKMTVTQGGKRLGVTLYGQENVFMIDDRYFRSKKCAIYDYAMEDIEVTFQYYINPLLKISPVFNIEKLEDFVDNQDQSKTFALEDATVTVRAETSAYTVFSLKDDDGVRTLSEYPSIRWKFSLPTKFEIEEVYVTQGESLFYLQSLERDVFVPKSDDQDIQNLFCEMHDNPTGDVQMILEYRVKGEEELNVVDAEFKTSPIFTIEKIENLVGNQDQSKTFVIEGRTVTLHVETSSYHTFNPYGYEQITKPGVKLTLSHPLDLEIKEVHAASEKKCFLPRYMTRNTPSDDRIDPKQTSFSIRENLTGDIQMVFEYRIKPID